MLDTVILKIPKSCFKILKWDRFHLVSSPINPNGLVVCRIYANNATSAEKKAVIYRPRLTFVDQMGREDWLKVEFSAQTILFGNTFAGSK